VARNNLVFLAAAVILSLHTVPYELRVCFPPPPHGDDSPEALAAGIASTPYQYRVLVPWVVRGAMDVGLIRPEWQMAAFAAIQLAFLVALAFAFRRYLSLFITHRRLVSVMALTIFAVLPFNYFNAPYYPYDVPSVMFFIVGLLLIHERRWAWYYPLFVIATFNRETSIFLVVAGVFAWFDRYPPGRVALLAGSQLAIWVAIKSLLWFLYRHNRWLGYGLYQFQLKVNLLTLVDQPIKAVIALATWGCLWLAVVLWYHRIKDEFLKRNLWMIPVFIAGMFVVGFVIELRIYGEVLPIVLAAFWVVFLDLVETATRERSVEAGLEAGGGTA